MAGIAFGIAGLGICHAMGHPLSALLNKAHGQTLSTMLPHMCAPHFSPLASKLFQESVRHSLTAIGCVGRSMEFNLPVRADKYALVAQAFGVHDASASDEDNARSAIAACAELSKTVGTAMSIEQLGGTAEVIAEAVQQAIT